MKNELVFFKKRHQNTNQKKKKDTCNTKNKGEDTWQIGRLFAHIKKDKCQQDKKKQSNWE